MQDSPDDEAERTAKGKQTDPIAKVPSLEMAIRLSNIIELKRCFCSHFTSRHAAFAAVFGTNSFTRIAPMPAPSSGPAGPTAVVESKPMAMLIP
jgi:hypothetical protein